jgi:hypothetical protein
MSINLWYKEALFFKKSLRQRGRNEDRVLIVEERASLLQAVSTSFEQVASQKKQRKSVLRPFGRSLTDLLLPFFLSVEITHTPSGQTSEVLRWVAELHRLRRDPLRDISRKSKPPSAWIQVSHSIKCCPIELHQVSLRLARHSSETRLRGLVVLDESGYYDTIRESQKCLQHFHWKTAKSVYTSVLKTRIHFLWLQIRLNQILDQHYMSLAPVILELPLT